MSEPIQSSEPQAPAPGPRSPAKSGRVLFVLKLALFVGAVLFLQRVVLPRLGLFT
jgi:hypothetical protein